VLNPSAAGRPAGGAGLSALLLDQTSLTVVSDSSSKTARRGSPNIS
jgi:hypothetical protein